MPQQSASSTSSSNTTTNQDIIQVYRNTVNELYRYVARRTAADRALTEDITQETYLRALQHWQSKPLPEGNPLPFLYTIARNITHNHFRKKQPTTITAEHWQSFLQQHPASTTSEPPPENATNTTIQSALARINQKQARLLEAFHLDQRSVKELALEYQLTAKAVERRLDRARAALRKRLAPLLTEASGASSSSS